MNPRELVIALAQLKLSRDRPAKLERGLEVIREAARKGADLVVFPELYLGYPLMDYPPDRDAEPLDGETLRTIRSEAAKNQIAVLMGFPEKDYAGGLYNSAFLTDKEGNILLCYRKTHLWITEDSRIIPGSEFPVALLDRVEIGVLICFDVQFPEAARMLAIKGAEVILIPSANTVEYSHCHRVNMMSRALENKVFTALCNGIGPAGPYQLGGLSALSDPRGRILAEAGQEDEEVVIGKLDLALVQGAREEFDYLKVRRPEIYKGLCL